MGFIVPPPPGHPREREIWEAIVRFQKIQMGVLLFAIVAVFVIVLLCAAASEGGAK
jgi:hypothetical protein